MADSPSSQKISDLSEEEIIRLFSGSSIPRGAMGIGDDCAASEGPGGLERLISTDLLVEDVHFRLDSINAEDLGHKALAVNISDIAAMGGTSDGYFLSLALPGMVSINWLQRFRNGLTDLAQKYDIPLLGGDTTRSESHIMISVTIMGIVNPDSLKLRSMAEPGDRICVTGPLGDSVAGLKILSHPHKYQSLSDNHRKKLIQRHCKPDPAVYEGKWLGQQDEVHAMIDISDGLLSDVRHIAEQSDCKIEIALDRLPLTPAFEAFCSIEGTDKQARELAAVGGEDYQLLFSVAESHISDLKDQFREKFGKPLYDIGKVTKREPRIVTLWDGSPVEVNEQKFKHFS
ncbi:thiamine-phosphate kinase [Aliifodinibius salicampi]|uniref:Thiamine-monophosphate kinase n=1 Tax=Fodinibius salicampi TaxID=1920655 RepID=A0ABT3Q2U4_9BACT|nr:thiamine-phosphate kinase [Fodinibius salicampi]MCW9714435.1 thiamine-phosphate kinase [Fodinibius salicampi]